MGQMVVSVPDDLQEELERRAADCGGSIGEVIERAVAAEKELFRRRALEALQSLRADAAETWPEMTDDELMEWAVAITHEVREEMAAERAH